LRKWFRFGHSSVSKRRQALLTFLRQKGWNIMSTTGKVRRWSYRFLLAIELMVVLQLMLGGCYSSQNYHVVSPQTGDELLNKCDVIVEGRIVAVRHWKRTSWGQKLNPLALCGLTEDTPSGPDRYDVSIHIDQVLKGDPLMQSDLRVNDCRPLRPEETALLSLVSDAFPNHLRVRIGFNRYVGGKLQNLVVVPLPDAPTTQPAPSTQQHLPRIPRIPMPPGVRRAQ
jgi:hypothetical protein